VSATPFQLSVSEAPAITPKSLTCGGGCESRVDAPAIRDRIAETDRNAGLPLVVRNRRRNRRLAGPLIVLQTGRK
jgi:hypothetical protein